MADGSYNILVGIEPDVTGLQQKLDSKTKNIKKIGRASCRERV